MTHGMANMERDKKSKGGKMKIDVLLMTVFCFLLAGFCYYFNYTQVAPNSVKHTLELCMWASLVLGIFGIGIALSPAGRK